MGEIDLNGQSPVTADGATAGAGSDAAPVSPRTDPAGPQGGSDGENGGGTDNYSDTPTNPGLRKPSREAEPNTGGVHGSVVRRWGTFADLMGDEPAPVAEDQEVQVRAMVQGMADRWGTDTTVVHQALEEFSRRVGNGPEALPGHSRLTTV